MVAIICQLEMIIYEANSLKEKRSVIKSIIEKTRKKYYISIIESNFHDYWQKSELSFSFCSIQVKDARKKLEGIIKSIESNPYIEIYETNIEEVTGRVL
ncbi:DUF503 family protein [Alkalibaculum sp. M08DMB]|uniref:DUF503 family protein n=1 Tax=Alkalibaculum sporogenes TaxID=2655001 RepID=A0A6A7K6I7_9FIRM|nr:DUF503 domain-containing protein [Alkalibaculum sporogenes]MPW24985.1 DUF503 family protein [Alkalibaculum sporogenes]